MKQYFIQNKEGQYYTFSAGKEDPVLVPDPAPLKTAPEETNFESRLESYYKTFSTDEPYTVFRFTGDSSKICRYIYYSFGPAKAYAQMTVQEGPYIKTGKLHFKNISDYKEGFDIVCFWVQDFAVQL